MLSMSKPLEKSTRDTLKLLEQMAADASLQDESILQKVIEQAEINTQQRALVIAKNSQELAEILQLDELITSVSISSPDEDDEEEQKEEEKSKENIRSFG